ncbi:uncharacterized protein LOC129232623 [Uloborus diversus]|uniref:uncharacterized protein LOC129232623 n=1 Tax=Uloborus diversus TaxID=327109 RepID=UPI00240A31D7|nr:uncharacterized protein LOC129232623 [Uloborus diversus]
MDNAVEKDAESSSKDFRIDCSTTRGLQNIMNTVGKYVAEMSDSVVELPEEKEAFTRRFLGIFKSSLQENVTVNGLPWIPDKHALSSHEKEEEEHNQKEVLVSRLCKSISDVGQKRKTFPPQGRKVLAMKHQHALENLLGIMTF